MLFELLIRDLTQQPLSAASCSTEVLADFTDRKDFHRPGASHPPCAGAGKPQVTYGESNSISTSPFAWMRP